MSWDELRTRSQQAAGKRWDAALYHLGARAHRPQLLQEPISPGRFFFSAADLPRLITTLRERLPADAQRVVEQAERICRHRFDLLGYENLDYGREIDWHLDAVHGKRPPFKAWFRIRYLDFGETGDHKIIWELNRHQHLVTLAKAWLLTSDRRLVAELLHQFRDWLQKNPYPIGINWASSLEVAFRSLSWIWMGQLLARCRELPEDFDVELRNGVALHGRHIERYLSTYFSPNTHLLGEAVALFFIGTLYPELASASHWRAQGWKIVLEEARRQVRADGFHFEQSVYYHVYALDFFLHARILAERNRIPIPAYFDETLLRMLEVLNALGQAGAPPRFGDDDGGRLFDPRRNRAEHMLDPLSTGAVLFSRDDFKAAVPDLCEETLWLMGRDGVAAFDELPVLRPALASRGFRESGLYVMASSDPEPRRLAIQAGTPGMASGGHSHADLFSIAISAGGRELTSDPGTFCYISEGGQRDRFRATSAHSTVCVDGQSQSDAAGPFAWRLLPGVRVDTWIEGETFDLFAATHSGYLRLAEPVTHERSVFHVKSQFWLVRDRLLGEGMHAFDVFWHLAPGFRGTKIGNTPVQWTREADRDRTRFMIVPLQQQGWLEAVESGELSAAYGVSDQAPVLRFSKRVRLPAEFAAIVRVIPRDRGESREEPLLFEQMLAEGGRASSAGYSYNDGHGHHYVFFAEPGQLWELGTWASDAQLLYWRSDAEGRTDHVVLCRGSYVRIGGREAILFNQPVERCEWRRGEAGNQFFCAEEPVIADFELPIFASGARPIETP